MKFSTETDIQQLPVRLSFKDKIMVLGSCFADSVGRKLEAAGFDVCVNPFGTLYNPASIAMAAARLESGLPFTEEDCVEMGAGSGLICSFEHHTSFAKETGTGFLEHANERLKADSAFWKACNKVIVTYGTSYVWNHSVSSSKTHLFQGITKMLGTNFEHFPVSNCLKRPAKEFSRTMLSSSQTEALTRLLIESNPDKEFIFTVSPIRHMSDGAHANTISKSALHLGLHGIEGLCYFPAFEILNDELRDYRFYARDLVHPSDVAVDYVWEKFIEAAIAKEDVPTLHENEKAARRLAHRPLR